MATATDMWDKTFKPRDELVTRRIVGETLLVPIRGKVADMQCIFATEGVGDEVWGSLDGQTPLSEIRDTIAHKYDQDAEAVAQDLAAFINDLLDNDLVAEVVAH